VITVMEILFTPLLVLFTQLYGKTIGFYINAFKFHFQSQEHEVMKL